MTPLKRRCFYYWVDYPDAERELEILSIKAPQADEKLSRQVVEFVQRLRDMDLFKVPRYRGNHRLGLCAEPARHYRTHTGSNR